MRSGKALWKGTRKNYEIFLKEFRKETSKFSYWYPDVYELPYIDSIVKLVDEDGHSFVGYQKITGAPKTRC
jgi:hypothetical protein